MRGWGKALIVGAMMALTVAEPLAAQSNDNDYTPLNSRIRRNRQFPTDIVNPWRQETGSVTKARGRAMLGQFSKCIFNRSREGSLALLQKTDLGFQSFAQVNLDNDRALRVYGFKDCLQHVASMNSVGVALRFTPAALRQWLVEEAYLSEFPEGPSWVRPGNVIAQRDYPLSARVASVHAAMDFADCVVAADPYTADFFYRTEPNSDEEKRAVNALGPSLGPCIPQGQTAQFTPQMLRVWLGEALWHAAAHSGPSA